MERARDALDRALRSLLAGADHVADASLCGGCGGLLEVPLEWCGLQDFPVLARYCVTQWTHLAKSADTAFKKAMLKQKYRVSRLAALCVLMHGCGVLTAANREVAQSLVTAVTTEDLQELLQQRSVPLTLRLLLLVTRIHYEMKQKPTAHAVWVQESCGLMQDALLDVSTDKGSSGSKSKKRSRAMMTHGNGRNASQLCGVCESLKGSSRSKDQLWARDELRAIAVVLTKVTRDKMDADDATKAAIAALQGLIDIITQQLESTLKVSKSARMARTAEVSKRGVLWEDCDKYVEASTTYSNRLHVMWRTVWTKESARHRNAKHISFVRLIQLCARIDQFTGRAVVPTSANGSNCPQYHVGFSILLQASQEECCRLFDILEAIYGAQQDSDVRRSSTKRRGDVTRMLQGYYRHALEAAHESIPVFPQSEVTSRVGRKSARAKTSSASQTQELTQLLHVTHSMYPFDDHPSHKEKLFAAWYLLLQSHSPEEAESSVQPWLSWLSWLVQSQEAFQQKQRTRVDRTSSAVDFDKFVSLIASNLILSNGTKLCFGQTESSLCSKLKMEISLESEDQSDLLIVLSLLLTSSSTRCVADVIYAICQHEGGAPINTQDPVATMETWSAIRRLLFPSLASFVQTASQVSGTSNEKVLASVLSTVLGKIKTGMVSNEHTRALLRLIQKWDEYCERTNEFPESSGSKMGLQVMSQLPVVPSIVRCYNSRDVLIGESPDMLQFVEELLRAASDSPPKPEGRVFELVSWIREIPSRSVDNQSNNTLISHSDEAIRRVLSVFHDHIDGHCRWVLEELATQQRIDDFARCLREWLARLNGFASDHKETRQELIRLGNRFVYWTPSRSQSLRAVFSPVDVNLLTALRGVTDGQQVSIVRLNLLMRSYLSGSNVPNLLALTGALVDTALLAPSSESLHRLFKLVQLFSGWIVVEVVVDKVQAGLILDRSLVQSARNTEQEALLRLQNALTFTAESSRFLQPWRLRFTSHLFSLQVAEQWLVQFIRPSTSYQMDFVDIVLGFITGHERDALREAFTLAALFSTILISVSSEAPEWVERVSDLTVQLTTQLAQPAQQSDTPVKSTDTALLYLKAVANDVECSRVCVPRYGERPVVVDSWRVSASSARCLLNCEFISEAPQFFLPFDSWLRATLAVSATPWTGDSHGRWDDTWIEMVVAFYLPLQFKDNVRALLFAWLQTWLGMQIEGVNSSDLVRLDASQRSLFWQLCSRVSDQSAWTYLVECVRITLADCQGSIHLLEMAVASLDLVQRSILVLSHQQEGNSILDELTEAIVSLSKTKPHDGSDLSAAVYVQLLSPVLEVFVYAAAIQSSDKLTSERVRLNTKAVAEAITRYAFGVRGDSQESRPAKTMLTRLLERWRGLYGHLNRQRVGDVMQMLLAEVVHQE